ncbi:MAG: alkaline phosphatase D family protein, partial [Pseudomonadota bacterium]|nr:alkaline phosphatase D family protein [Pseudomonadota bacterium]
MRFSMSRRQMLAGLSSASLLPLTGCSTEKSEPKIGDRFRHGVASGDPDNNSLIIWTRVTSDKPFENVTWEVATDAQFNGAVASGVQTTSRERDFTVKVLVQKLQPGKIYYYRFKVSEEVSDIGRTKTLPEGHVSRLGLAVASCSNFPFGYFNAYETIAKDEQVDLVLHLGDYIYEYADNGWGSDVGKTIGRIHQPANEIVSLDDYRQRHAQYKTDRGSQMMHSAHPLIPIWDDHESTNNPWMEGAQNHQPETEGEWGPRRDASVQAYYEWMPIREPQLGMSRAQYWR